MDGTGTKTNPASGDNVAAYTVSRLADGNCWMTRNLALQIYTGSNTNPTPTPIEVVDNTTGKVKGSLWTPNGTGGTSNAATALNGNTICTGSGTSKQCWYTWYAATAGSGTSGQTDTDASDSICPAGWRLPSNYTTSTTKSYGALTQAYFGFNTNQSQNKISVLEANPMLFTRAGSSENGNLNNSSNGYYRSATAYPSSGYAYTFNYETSYTRPQYDSGKNRGLSVRCLAV